MDRTKPESASPLVADAVSSAGVQVQASAPAVATGHLMGAESQALSNAAHNAVNQQLGVSTTLQASTVQAVSLIFGIDTAATAVGITKIMEERPKPRGNRPIFPPPFRRGR